MYMLEEMTEVKFVAKISPMGDKYIIIIPKDFHKAVKPLTSKQVRVRVDDEI